MRMCSLRLIAAAALAFATPASTVSPGDIETIEITRGNRANAPMDEDAAGYLDGTIAKRLRDPAAERASVARGRHGLRATCGRQRSTPYSRSRRGLSSGSAEAARDVVFGELVARIREDVVRVADLDEVPRWKYAVRCDTRAACCIECVTIAMA
jgi:hypothetical protein